jgi:hypothetical protein
MFMTKVKIATGLLLALGVLGAGGGVIAYQNLAAQQAGQTAYVSQSTSPRNNSTLDESRENTEKHRAELQILPEEKVKELLAERTDLNEKLRELLRQRHDAAVVQVTSRFREFQAGRGTLEFMLNSTRHYYEAERDLSDKKPNQVAALERRLALLKEVETAEETRFKEGRVPVQNLALTRFHRLEAEIALERLRSK